jgi:hypothetical protein
MQRAQFFRRTANIQNVIVGSDAERVLLSGGFNLRSSAFICGF